MSPKAETAQVATLSTAPGRRGPHHTGTGPSRTSGKRLTVGPASVAQLRAAMASPVIVQAYRKRIQMPAARGACHVWTGARSATGHGWFWIANGRVVIADRFGYALAYGVDTLLAVPALGHGCDNPLCQNTQHIGPALAEHDGARASVVRQAATRDGHTVEAAILGTMNALRRRSNARPELLAVGRA